MSESCNWLEIGGIWSSGYGMVAKTVMRDRGLSAEAKAIYGYMCSFDGGSEQRWNTRDMQVELGLADAPFWAAWHELSDYLAAHGEPVISVARAV